MQAPKSITISGYFLHRSSPGFLRLCGPPSIPLSFNLAVVLPRWITYRFRFTTDSMPPTVSYHRLPCGLPGYLILFDPHTLVPQRQSRPRQLTSLSVFCVISMHFTATLHIPPASPKFQYGSFYGTPHIEYGHFTTDLPCRLRTL